MPSASGTKAVFAACAALLVGAAFAAVPSCGGSAATPPLPDGGSGGGGGGSGGGPDGGPEGGPDGGGSGVPFEQGSPWPKFRGNAAQDGRSAVKPSQTGGAFWSFPTGRGVFSSPVVAADGTVYVGSADRTFYALGPDGKQKWSLLTGEIIDSAALLDDRGRVYFGSGDGKLRALDASTGKPVWTMDADPPTINSAFINWFEGNVAIGPSGTLYVPNDNFFVYAVDRDAGTPTWRYKMPDRDMVAPRRRRRRRHHLRRQQQPAPPPRQEHLRDQPRRHDALGEQLARHRRGEPGADRGRQGDRRRLRRVRARVRREERRAALAGGDARSRLCQRRAPARRYDRGALVRRYGLCARSGERRAEVGLRHARAPPVVARGGRRGQRLLRVG